MLDNRKSHCKQQQQQQQNWWSHATIVSFTCFLIGFRYSISCKVLYFSVRNFQENNGTVAYINSTENFLNIPLEKCNTLHFETQQKKFRTVFKLRRKTEKITYRYQLDWLEVICPWTCSWSILKINVALFWLPQCFNVSIKYICFV